MRRPILAAALACGLALPGGAALAQVETVACATVMQVTLWESQWTDRGYWSSTVNYRNTSQLTIMVTAQYRGQGMIVSPSRELAPGASTMRHEVARTSARLSTQHLTDQTSFICTRRVRDS